MKKFIHALCLMLVVSSSVYSQEIKGIENLLDKEWKHDPTMIETTVQKYYKKILSKAQKKNDKKEIKDLKANKKSYALSLKKLLVKTTYQFSSDSLMITNAGGEIIEGKWVYNNTGKTLSFINSTNGEIDQQIVYELTPSKFTFIDQNGYKITLVPASPKKAWDPLTLKEDLDIYRNIVENAHSGMYLYTSKETFNTLFEEAYQKTPSLKNTREFYKLIAGIHTKINCGHSSFYPSGKVFSEIKNNATSSFFPFKVKFLKDNLVIAQDYENFKKGTQIISINGNTIKQITDETFKLLSSDGYNTTFKYRLLEDDFSTNYFLAFGSQEKFIIEHTSDSGTQKKQVEVVGISSSKLESTITESHYNTPYYLEYIDNNTALLTVNTFSTETRKNQKKFFKFLEQSFSEINKKGIKNLILDIRENTGGDDGNDMELASYFIDTHFKENKFRKLNTLDNFPPHPEYLLSEWFETLGIDADYTPKEIQNNVKKEIAKQMDKGDGEAYYWKEDAVIHRDPAKNKFTGNAYILISGKVFSGGGLFSALVRDKSDAIFIGEETGGGYYRHTGTIPLYYSLPNSNLIFTLFVVINEQDVNRKLFPEGSGTRPQHQTHPTIKEFIKGTDVVLEKAKQLIVESK